MLVPLCCQLAIIKPNRKHFNIHRLTVTLSLGKQVQYGANYTRDTPYTPDTLSPPPWDINVRNLSNAGLHKSTENVHKTKHRNCQSQNGVAPTDHLSPLTPGELGMGLWDWLPKEVLRKYAIKNNLTSSKSFTKEVKSELNSAKKQVKMSTTIANARWRSNRSHLGAGSHQQWEQPSNQHICINFEATRSGQKVGSQALKVIYINTNNRPSSLWHPPLPAFASFVA